VPDNATIVVSGGGTGIGRAVAHHLVADGKHVTVVGRRRSPLDAVRAELGRVDVVAADVSTEAGAAEVAECVTLAGRRCAGVVAAAGGLALGADGERSLSEVRTEWQASFESNVLTAVLLVEALRAQLEGCGGRVVLLSSIAAYRGAGGGPYAAMKAALHGWVHDLARELGAYGGTANVVAPGFVPDTEFWADRLTEDGRARRVAQTFLGREGKPGEVASLIGWLFGRDAGWFTGQIISPNGGVVPGR
jgi:3-oxoacyl-[acyl-carrier protein] reductase